MKTVFEQLKEEYQVKLVNSVQKYSSAGVLIEKLKSKNLWSELTIGEYNSFCTWADIDGGSVGMYDVKYGDRFLNKE